MTGAFGRRTGTEAGHIGLTLWAITAVLLVGTALDYGILWIGQRQDTLTWEYVAIVNTVEGMGSLIVALALAYAAFYVSGRRSVAVERALAGLVMMVGVFGGALGFLLIMDYLALRSTMEPTAAELFTTTTVKGMTLSGLYFFVLVPIGLRGLLRAGKE